MSETITILLRLLSLLRLMLRLVPGDDERSAIKNTIAKAIEDDLGEDDVRNVNAICSARCAAMAGPRWTIGVNPGRKRTPIEPCGETCGCRVSANHW